VTKLGLQVHICPRIVSLGWDFQTWKAITFVLLKPTVPIHTVGYTKRKSEYQTQSQTSALESKAGGYPPLNGKGISKLSSCSWIG
jgi:hypothetical protein